MKSIHLAWISLKRRPWSTLLAVASLAIPLAILSRTAELYHYLERGLTAYDQTVQIVVAPKSSSLEILLESLYGIGESGKVLPFALVTEAIHKQGITRQVTPMALFGHWSEYPVFATDDSFMERPEGIKPPQIDQGEWFEEPGQVVLGSEVARRTGTRIGDKIECVAPFFYRGSTEPIWSRELTVVGILAPTRSGHDRRILGTLRDAFDMQRVAIPLKMIREVSNQQAVSWFMVWVKPHQEQALKRFIDEKTVGYTMIVRDSVRQLQSLFQGAVKVGHLTLAAVLTLGGLCLAILLNTRFEGMIEELAVLRALGYGKAQVAGWLLGEGWLLTLAALVPSLVLDGILMLLIQALASDMLPWAGFTWPGSQVFRAWLLFLVVVFPAQLLPLWRLYRLDVHHALRGL